MAAHYHPGATYEDNMATLQVMGGGCVGWVFQGGGCEAGEGPVWGHVVLVGEGPGGGGGGLGTRGRGANLAGWRVGRSLGVGGHTAVW